MNLQSLQDVDTYANLDGHEIDHEKKNLNIHSAFFFFFPKLGIFVGLNFNHGFNGC